MLRSGRALYAQWGCRGLSQRRLAEHAGINPGMFHYHFRRKDDFLRALLQQLYDEMFVRLAEDAERAGPAIERLNEALQGMARHVRAQRPLVARLALDAAQGEPVAREFVRANAPRHLQLLIRLLAQAQAEGSLPAATAPMQQAVLLMGAVIVPMVLVPAMVALDLPLPTPLQPEWVTSDAAIAERVALALHGLQQAAVSPPTAAGAAR